MISEGLYIPAETKTKNIFTHRRKYKEQEILAIHNFSKEQLEIEFDEENSILFKDAKVLISNIDRKFFEKKFVLEPFESSIFIKAH